MISTARRSVVFLLFLSASAGSLHAYDESEADKMAEEIAKNGFQVVTTKEGLRFNVPSDMPIQRKDGLVQPVPFEEYLYIKFKKIEQRVVLLDEKVKKMDEKLSSKLDELLRRSSSGPSAPDKAPPREPS